MNNKLQTKLLNSINHDSGYFGAKVIVDTTATTPSSGYEFFMVQAITETVVAANSSPTSANDEIDLTDLTAIPAGSKIYGRWNSITLTSGELIAYQTVAQTTVD